MSTTGTVPSESKSAKKRKVKGENAASESGAATPIAEPIGATDNLSATNGVDAQGDTPFLKELSRYSPFRTDANKTLTDTLRNIRNLHKKLAASSKADAVISENPDVSLDELVATKKLNADQKAQILKKPALQTQLAQLEEQLTSFRAFAQEIEDRAAKEKASLGEAHEAAIASIKEKAVQEAEDAKTQAVEDALRVITHFLHTAASKRQSEEADSEEGRAFEGALLLVYQGNEASLSTLKNLVYGTEEKVPDVHNEPLDFTFAQIKQSALQRAQEFAQSTEPEGDDPQADTAVATATPEVQTDATIANAGLTELDDITTIQTSAPNAPDPDGASVLEQASTGEDAANAVAEASWDPQASMVTDGSAINEEWVQVPRDPAETDTGLAATPAAAHGTSNWAEEVGAAAAADDKTAVENDGFEQVRRERGRGRGRGGRGEFRGRGRGGRGDGHRGGRGGAPRGRGGANGQRGGGGGGDKS